MPAPESDLIQAQTLEEKELEHLKKLYPDEYTVLYAEEYAQPRNAFFTDNPSMDG